LATAALLGCGSDDDEEPEAATREEPTAVVASDDPRYPKDPNLPYPFNYPEPNKPPKPGGTLRVAATWDVSTMDPTKSAAGGTITVPNLIYSRLIDIKGGPDADPFKVETEPGLAQSWERSPDGLVYTFKFAPGIKWHNAAPLNGRELVSADVAAAYKRYAAEGVHQSYHLPVDRYETPDPKTLRIVLKSPTPEFELPLASRYQTIFPPELVDNGEIDKKVIGTGPMILQEATPAQRVTMVKNPDYFRSDVLLDGAEFRIMPDAASRLAAFRAGQLEYGYSIVSGKRDVDELLKQIPDLQVNHPALVHNGTPLSMNLSNPKFTDVRIRRAMSLALDRTAILALLYENIGDELLHTIPWTAVFDSHPDTLGPWVRHDIAEAKKLLQAAGAEDFSFNYIYYQYTTTSERLSEIIVDQMRNAGITMNGGKVDYTEFNSQWIGAKLPEVTTTGYGAIGFDLNTYFYNQIHSSSPGNRWQLKDPQMDKWAEEQASELDPEVRREVHRKIWDYDLEQMFRPPLPLGYGFDVQQPWLRGIRFGGILSKNSSYYDWGAQIEGAWLDK
jgi:peptide/nickel transport system substrate-binding protein